MHKQYTTLATDTLFTDHLPFLIGPAVAEPVFVTSVSVSCANIFAAMVKCDVLSVARKVLNNVLINENILMALIIQSL